MGLPGPGLLEWIVPLPGSVVEIRLAIGCYDMYSRKRKRKIRMLHDIVYAELLETMLRHS
jgi:hypothetical protein